MKYSTHLLLCIICLYNFIVLIQSAVLYPDSGTSTNTFTGPIKLNKQVTVFSKSYNEFTVENYRIIFKKNPQAQIVIYKDFSLQGGTSTREIQLNPDSTVMDMIKEDVKKLTYFKSTNPIFDSFEPKNAVIITWSSTWNSMENKFQMAFSYDAGGTESFVIFNYKKLEWACQNEAACNKTNGLSINLAQLSKAFLEASSMSYHLPGSGTVDVRISLEMGSNCGVAGKWVFKTSGNVEDTGKMTINAFAPWSTGPGNGKLYKNFFKPLSQSSSEVCKDNNAEQVAPKDAAENTFITSLGDGPIDLPMTYKRGSSRWAWKSGDWVIWNNWKWSNDPKDGCAVMLRGMSGKAGQTRGGWINVKCTGSLDPNWIHHAVCQKDAPTTTTTATTTTQRKSTISTRGADSTTTTTISPTSGTTTTATTTEGEDDDTSILVAIVLGSLLGAVLVLVAVILCVLKILRVLRNRRGTTTTLTAGSSPISSEAVERRPSFLELMDLAAAERAGGMPVGRWLSNPDKFNEGSEVDTVSSSVYNSVGESTLSSAAKTKSSQSKSTNYGSSSNATRSTPGSRSTPDSKSSTSTT